MRRACLVLFAVSSFAFQDAQTVRVGFVIVASPLTSRHIFEYVNAYIPEGKTVPRSNLACFKTALMKTRLFKDVTAELDQNKELRATDVKITPVWVDSIDSYALDQLNLIGFDKEDEREVRRDLERSGYVSGMRFLDAPPFAMRDALQDTENRLEYSDQDRGERLRKQIDASFFELKVTGVHKVSITILTRRPRCGR